MKKLDSVQQTLIDMGFVIDEKNENYVLGEVAIPAVEIIGHTVGSFLEKGKRRGWLHQEPMGVGKSTLPNLGMIFENNIVYGNLAYGTQMNKVWLNNERTRLVNVVGTHTMGICTIETPPELPPMKIERSKDGKTWEQVAAYGDAVADESGFFYSVD